MNRLIRCVVKEKLAFKVTDYLEELGVRPEEIVVSRARERLSLTPPAPMTEGRKSSSKQSHNGASAHVDVFIANARQAGLKQITGKQLVQHMKMGGFNPYSHGYRVTQLLKAKELKRTRQPGVYEVV